MWKMFDVNTVALCNVFFTIISYIVHVSEQKSLLFLLDLLAGETQLVIAQVCLEKNSTQLTL